MKIDLIFKILKKPRINTLKEKIEIFHIKTRINLNQTFQ